MSWNASSLAHWLLDRTPSGLALVASVHLFHKHSAHGERAFVRGQCVLRFPQLMKMFLLLRFLRVFPWDPHGFSSVKVSRNDPVFIWWDVKQRLSVLLTDGETGGTLSAVSGSDPVNLLFVYQLAVAFNLWTWSVRTWVCESVSA